LCKTEFVRMARFRLLAYVIDKDRLSPLCVTGDVAWEVGVDIKRLGPDDWRVFRTLRLAALRTDPAAFASSISDWEALDREEWQARMATVLVAGFVGTAPIGLAACLGQRSSKMAHRADVIMVWVHPDHRGRGAAAALLRALEAPARVIGIRQLELAVTGENAAARRVYDRLGYGQVGVIPGGFCHEGREIDEVLMAKRIDGQGRL